MVELLKDAEYDDFYSFGFVNDSSGKARLSGMDADLELVRRRYSGAQV